MIFCKPKKVDRSFKVDVAFLGSRRSISPVLQTLFTLLFPKELSKKVEGQWLRAISSEDGTIIRFVVRESVVPECAHVWLEEKEHQNALKNHPLHVSFKTTAQDGSVCYFVGTHNKDFYEAHSSFEGVKVFLLNPNQSDIELLSSLENTHVEIHMKRAVSEKNAIHKPQ